MCVLLQRNNANIGESTPRLRFTICSFSFRFDIIPDRKRMFVYVCVAFIISLNCDSNGSLRLREPGFAHEISGSTSEVHDFPAPSEQGHATESDMKINGRTREDNERTNERSTDGQTGGHGRTGGRTWVDAVVPADRHYTQTDGHERKWSLKRTNTDEHGQV